MPVPSAPTFPLLPLLALALALLNTSLLHAEPNSSPHHQVVPNWPALPPNHTLGLCAGVGVDSNNRVFVFHRCGRKWQTPFPKEPIAEDTVTVIDGATGKLITSWGAGRFNMPHGLTIDHENNVWLTDVGLHQVFKCTPDGKVLLTLGVAREPGADHTHFNLPTDVAVLPDGSFYVSDGYKNTRVIKFTADGRYEFEWGAKGDAPGQFNLPHGIALDPQGRVFVCDRTHSRLQLFDPRGKFLDQWKGPHLGRPYGVEIAPNGHIFIIDGGQPSGARQIAKGNPKGEAGGPNGTAQGAKAVELNPIGKVVNTFGSFGPAPGQFQMGHDIAIGPDGAIYVAEGSGARVQKFVKNR